MEDKQLKELEVFAAKIRRDILEMLQHRGYGHVGGSLSLVEAYAVIYGKQGTFDPSNPAWPGRDRVVLSKGHAGPVMYSTLAEKGYFPKEWLMTLNDGGTNLPSHTDRNKTPGVDVTTGSLGQGTSQAAGIAKALKLKGEDPFVYLFVGDGELNEGQCWEAFQFIAKEKLDNLIVFIDDNKRQLDGWTDDVMENFDLAKKMEAFGFFTQRVNGNDIAAVDEAMTAAKAHKGEALCIVLDTVKGAGIPFFEETVMNHSMKWDNDKINGATDEAIAKLDEIIEGGVA